MTKPKNDFYNIIEAALFSSETPLSVKQLQSLFTKTKTPMREEILTAISALTDEYRGRGVELIQAGGGYRFQTRAVYADWLRRLRELRPPRYSKALLETLAIIAYRQPVTRGDIEDIRGVTVTTEIMRALLDREWVRQSGVRAVPGHPALYATTPKFLAYFGLKTLDELPDLEDPRKITDIVQDLNLDFDWEEGEHLEDAADDDREGGTDRLEVGQPATDTEDFSEQTSPVMPHRGVTVLSLPDEENEESTEEDMPKVAAPGNE
jgi:segregation and condensation protein B